MIPSPERNMNHDINDENDENDFSQNTHTTFPINSISIESKLPLSSSIPPTIETVSSQTLRKRESKTKGTRVEETLAWVRKNSSIRRQKYRNQFKKRNKPSLPTNKLINGEYHYQQQQQQSPRRQKQEVESSLEKGRALLALTEAHMKHFKERFPSPRTNINVDDDYNAGVECCDQGDPSRKENHTKDTAPRDNGKNNSSTIDSLFMSTNDSNNSIVAKTDDRKNEYDDSIDDCDTEVDDAIEFMRKIRIEPRKNRPLPVLSHEYDNNIETHNTDDKTSATENSSPSATEEKRSNISSSLPISPICKSKNNTHTKKSQIQESTLPTQIVFNPNNLQGAKRALVHQARRDKELQQAQNEAIEKTNFKARPLPGGIRVRNDLFKPTKAALGKRQFISSSSSSYDNSSRENTFSANCISDNSTSEADRVKENDGKRTRTTDLHNHKSTNTKQNMKNNWINLLSSEEKNYMNKLFNVRLSKLSLNENDERQFAILKNSENLDPNEKSDSAITSKDGHIDCQLSAIKETIVVDSRGLNDGQRDHNQTLENENINALNRDISKLESHLDRKRNKSELLRKFVNKINHMGTDFFFSITKESKDDKDYKNDYISYVSNGNFQIAGVQRSNHSGKLRGAFFNGRINDGTSYPFKSLLHVSSYKNYDHSSKDTECSDCNSIYDNSITCTRVAVDGVYRRQEEWLHNLELKRQIARSEKEKKALENFTGKPQLQSTKVSWQKAKIAYAEALKQEQEEELQARSDKEARNQKIQQQKVDEIQDKKKLILKKEKPVKRKHTRSEIQTKAKEHHNVKHEEQKGATQTEKHRANDTKNKQNTGESSILNIKKNNCELEKKVENLNMIGESNDIVTRAFVETVKRRKKDSSYRRKVGSNMKVKSNKKNLSSSKIKMTTDKKLHTDSVSITKHNVSQKNNDDSNVLIGDESITTESNNESGQNGSRSQICFGDLDDTEFIRMMKKLGISMTSTIGRGEGKDVSDNVCTEVSNKKDDVENTNGRKSKTTTVEEMLKTVEQKLEQKLEQKAADILDNASSILNENHSNESMTQDIKKGGDFLLSSILSQNQTSALEEEPYQKYESGDCSFFDRSSSIGKGRFRVRDAKNFAPETMRRISFHDYCLQHKNESGDIEISDDKEENYSSSQNHNDLNSLRQEINIQDDNDKNSIKDPGVMILIAKKTDAECFDEYAITITFDRLKFSESAARDWWIQNRYHFV